MPAFAEPVVEETGLDLSFTSPTSYPKIRTQVETGNVSWTVIMANPRWSIKYCGELLEELPSAVDVSAIDPKYQVDDCGVAGDTFTFNVNYNSEEFSDDEPRRGRTSSTRMPSPASVECGAATSSTASSRARYWPTASPPRTSIRSTSIARSEAGHDQR